MGAKPRGLPIHGWLIVDKPAGPSSSAVVGRVKRATGAAKVGHGGTLDPAATGVLPIALGEATKTVAFVMDGTKAYRFTVRWGAATDTDDGEGAIVAESVERPEEASIRAALAGFVGDVMQVPPAYSALKVDGQRAYDLARADTPPTLAPRPVRIESLDLLGLADRDHAEFEVVCGKGTYVRSLARDLAVALGTLGHVAALRRTRVGGFGVERAISLEKLDELGHSAALFQFLLPIETALDDIPALALTEAEAQRLRRGQAVPALPVASRSHFRVPGPGGVACALCNGRAVALVKIAGGEIRPVRVLNL